MAKFNGFGGNYSGLSAQEVNVRQQQYGLNELLSEKKHTFLEKVLQILKEPMFLLLFGTALLYFLLGDPKDGVIMLGFVTFMAGINLFQEWRTDRTLQALKDMSSPKVRVIRDEEMESIDSRRLTVGDLFIIEEGEKIAADGKILEMFDLGVDESTLTGESEVVWKKLTLEQGEEGHWRRDRCYAGTTVTQGSAVIEVTAVGKNTAFGKIGNDILTAPDRPTPLEKQIRRLVRQCAGIGGIMLLLVVGVSLFHDIGIIDSIIAGITLAMAIIPEEFPVILTVFLAMGAWRLARKEALVRRMPSVETLGAVSVLCVDKTGTLTQNKMTVQALFGYRSLSEKELLTHAALACETEPYDPMEKAILAKADLAGLNRAEIFSSNLIHEYPFSSETKMMGHVWQTVNGPELNAKGSPESLLPLCRLSEEVRLELEAEQEKLAAQGYRVIAVARRSGITEPPKLLRDNELEFLGFIGLEDPPCEMVPNAVKVCARAGIRIVMITGDNGTTAQSIGRKIGLPDPDKIITGKQLEEMSDDDLREALRTTNIFARVIPAHKKRIVRALKELGLTVAMTGDGVNDAPALKYADIGIAMGKRGTGVAREAADLILLDDNFTTIIDTIKDGRRIYDNIRKAIGYVLVIHIPIAMAALLTPLLHMKALLLPIHVVLLELIIDPTCSIIFERQPAEKDLMEKPPRPSGMSLVNAGLLFKSILQGLAILAATLGSYIWLQKYHGASVEAARSFALVTLVLSNLFLVFVNQSEHRLTLTSILHLDKVILSVNLAIFIMIGLVIYTQIGNGIAKMQPLSWGQLGAAFLTALVATIWWDFVKLGTAFRNK